MKNIPNLKIVPKMIIVCKSGLNLRLNYTPALLNHLSRITEPPDTVFPTSDYKRITGRGIKVEFKIFDEG